MTCSAAVSLDHPTRAFEDAPDMRALHFLERATGRDESDGRRFGCRREQIAAVEHPATRHDHCALYQVFELANIARPTVGGCPLDECRGNSIQRPAELARGLRRKVLDQARNVAAAFPQRRHCDRKHVQAVVQISAETRRP